jgi:hypothetical protein
LELVQMEWILGELGIDHKGLKDAVAAEKMVD